MKLKVPRERLPNPLTKAQVRFIHKYGGQPVHLFSLKGGELRTGKVLRRKGILTPNCDGMFGTTQTYGFDNDAIARRQRPRSRRETGVLDERGDGTGTEVLG